MARWSVLLSCLGPIKLFMPFLFVCSNQPPGIGLRQAFLDPKMIAVFIPAPHRPHGFESFCRNRFNLLCHHDPTFHRQEINGDRQDYSWGMVPGAARDYGRGAMKIDASIRRAEPPDIVKGDIARTMFSMSATYGFNLAAQDRPLFTAWSRLDPPDAWEQTRNQLFHFRLMASESTFSGSRESCLNLSLNISMCHHGQVGSAHGVSGSPSCSNSR